MSGASFATVVTERPVPLGVTYGHTKGAVSNELAPVENEDVATFIATFDERRGRNVFGVPGGA